MNINYGLLPPLTEDGPKRGADGRRLSPTDRGRAKKRLMSLRAMRALEDWLGSEAALAGAA